VPPQRRFDYWLCRLLAGLQAGVVGGLVLAAYLWLENLLFARSAWQAPELFAAALLGPAATRLHFGFHTVVGYSLLLLCSGAMGFLFAVLVRPVVAAIWAANIGIAYSLAWYFLLLRRVLVGPMGGLPAGISMLGYFLFGAALSLYVGYYRQIARPLTQADVAGDSGSYGKQM
jgi:hypothetical protein